MKAAYIEQHGGPDVLKYGHLPDPIAKAGEVLIDIAAASVNGADWRVRAGHYGTLQFPYVLGRDFSGVVGAVGDGVNDLNPGDRVFGVCAAGQEGAYAEKIAVKAAIVAKKPDAMPHVEAAALALTGLTAISAVEETLKLQRGETILVQGGAGGVASFAIQFAKHIGARVISTASAANLEYVRGLGADEVMDYNAQDFTRIGPVCDAVFETVGGEVAQKSFAVLPPSAPRVRRPQSPIATTSPRCGRRSAARGRRSSASRNCIRPVLSVRRRSGPIACRMLPRRTG
jgi:NADPH:quinone reductase-like Zn-dependent oxidoreductase